MEHQSLWINSVLISFWALVFNKILIQIKISCGKGLTVSFLKQALWNLTSLTPKHYLGSNLSLPYTTASLICGWLRQPYPTWNKNGFLDIYVYLTATILSSFNHS